MTLASKYNDVFQKECGNSYPEVSKFEERCGFALDTARMQDAARILACPLKTNPPNWQHGRVIYAAARRLLADERSEGMFLDIGSAKGFSATVMTWAIADAKVDLPVWSVDIVDPFMRVSRNSVVEATDYEQLPTVPELVAQFIDQSVSLRFFGHGSVWLLKRLFEMKQRIRFAFVDGKHNFESVSGEMRFLASLQKRGDVTVIDDMQIPGVRDAINKVRDYDIMHITALELRKYAVAVRK